MATRSKKTIVLEAVLFIIAIIFISPVWIILANSFKPLGEILGNTLAPPKFLFLDNFKYVLDKMNYFVLLKNTLTITVFALVCSVILSAMCAYMLSRANDKKSWIILMVLFSSMIIPFQTIMIPLSKVASHLKLVDSIPGLILIMIPLYAPYATFVYHGFVRTIPLEIEEAAKIDGCSTLQTFFKIIFPLLLPATSSIVVLDAMWMWNDFALPVILLQSASNKTITITIYTFFSSVSMRWDYALAALTVSCIPIVIFYLFMQKYIIKGITAGSVKG